MTKRILSILLALSLVLGIVPVAFAVDEAATEIETEIAMPEESAEAQKSTESYDDTEAVITESDNEEDTEISLMETGDQNETTGEDEGENEAEPEPELISIAEAREAEDGANVKIEGILTYEIDSYVFIQDGTAALAIDSSLLSAFKSGDTYTIEGTLATVEGIRTIIPETATPGLRGQELPVTQYVTIGNLNDGSNQGELIRIENVYLEKVTEDGNLYLMDKNTGEHIYVYQPAALNEMIWEDSYIDVTAIAYIQDGAPTLRTTVENDIVFTRVPVEVYTEEDLNAMRNNMHYNYKLMADIEMTENWVCIGNNSKMFNGIFNGNGHTISNFNVVLDQEYQFIYAGLFGAIGQNGGVKNLTIEMTPGTGGVRAYDQVTNSYAGAITGFNKGTIENCHVTGIVHGKYYVGGIAGWNDGTIKNCSFNGSLEGTHYIGGVTGGSGSTGTVENCTTDVAFSDGSYAGGIAGQNNGAINECTATVSGSAGGCFGGIVGLYSSGTLENCKSYGTVSGSNNVGGIVGSVDNANNKSINVCESYATVSGSSSVGGIWGGYSGSRDVLVIVADCTNYGNVSGGTYVGGIVGSGVYYYNSSNSYYSVAMRLENCSVKDCNVFGGSYVGGCVGYNKGNSSQDVKISDSYVENVNVQANSTSSGSYGYAGGLIGYDYYPNVSNCHVNANISSLGGHNGGIIGYLYSGTIANSTYAGEIIGEGSYVGGIIGCAGSSCTVRQCEALADILGPSYIGGIVGYIQQNANSYIEQCSYMGTLSGTSFIGGMVGKIYQYGSSYVLQISNCYADVKIDGTGYLGGLVGYTEKYSSYTPKVSISKSFAEGSIEGTGNYVGGLVGYYDSTTNYLLTDNYATVDVKGSGYVGGFAGYISATSKVERNYSTGSVTASDPSTGGGFAGYNAGTNNVLRNYYDMEKSGQSDDTKGVPKTTAQMLRAASYVDWDFDTVWKISPDENGGYPQLRDTSASESDKYEPTVYYISTEDELIEALNKKYGVFEITSDIELTKDWEPVEYFYGTINGNGHTISNLNVNGRGFIGSMYCGEINNLEVSGSVVNSATTQTGMIVGYCKNSKLKNVYADGLVRGNGSTGGLVGYAYGADMLIENCGFNGDVRGSTSSSPYYYCGGLVGTMVSATAKTSYSKGSVDAYYSGGFVGYMDGAVAENSYSDANVSGSSNSSGFCYGTGSSNNIIKNCCSIGASSDGYGFLWRGNNATTTNCYYNKEVAKNHNSYGNGRTTEQMKDMSSYVDWDFDTVWAIDSGINDGYPYLRSTLPIPERVELTAQKETLFVGDTLQLEYSIYPENAPQLVSFASTDESVVTVSAGGFVTAIREGVATVSVRAGNQFDYVTFTVLTGQDSSTVISVDPIAQVELDYGATLDDAKGVLPTTVTALLSNGSKVILPVEWTLIDGSQYDFEGTLVIGSGSPISNPAEVKAQCSVKVLDQPSEIASVEAISVSVPYATPLANVTELLPETVAVTLKNGKTYNLFVVWDNDSTPYYRSTTPGTYVFGGQLVLPENGIILNSSSKKASVSVLVLEEPETEREITAVVGNENINVAYGTTLTAVKSMLPAQVNVVFDGVETLPVDVVWTNDSSPSYQPKVPGVYTFTGTIVTNGNGLITNPHNLFATISFVVAESETGEKNMYVSSESAAIGSTVDVEISVDSNSTMTSGSFVVDFDSTSLSPVSYVVGEAIDTASVMVNANYVDPSDGKRKIKVSYVAFDEMNKGGNMITFKFMVNNTVADGKTLPITLKDVCAYDISENPIAFSVYGGSVAASLVIYGDTNGDGLVNILDAFRVVRYDAGYLTFDEKQSISADVDKNHIIDIFDAMKIQRFDIGLSSVLGE